MTTDRPKRNIIKKKYDDSEGMPWCEERVVQKVLFLSLREFRNGQRSLHGVAGPGGSSAKGHGLRSTPKGDHNTNNRTKRSRRLSQNQHGSKEASEDNANRKRPRLQVQRKFAQSQPSSPGSTPLKTPPDIVTVALSSEMLNHKPPKTEDFLSFLCLRGTVALPGNMTNLLSVQDDVALQEEDPEYRKVVSYNSASCPVTNKSSRRQGKKMSASTVSPSHGRCLRDREPRVSTRSGDNVQGAERMETLIPSTTMGLPILPARASAPNHVRYPRVSQQPPQVPMVTGHSGITSSTRTSLRNQTSPLRLLPPRAARSSAPPTKTAALAHRSPVPPSSRLSSLPIKSPGPPSRSCLNLNKPRHVQKTKLSLRRYPNSRRSKPSNSRVLHRNPCCPKSNPRHTGSRHRSPHTNSGKNPSCIAKTSKQLAVPIQVARGQPIRHLHAQEGVQQSKESLRQSRRRRGLPAETDSVPDVMEVRLQVSGPQTRSRTLNHVGKVGRDSVVTSRHVGAVQSKPASGQKHTGESMLTRQAQSSQG